MPQTASSELRRRLSGVGFDPYRRIRRRRTTRRGDLIFVIGFALLIAAALVWAFV